IAEKWADVLEMVCKADRTRALEETGNQPGSGRERSKALNETEIQRVKARNETAIQQWKGARVRNDRRMYGAPFHLAGLAYEPVNEAGVMFLFGMVAAKLGLEVLRIQSEFPDCEAMQEVGPGKRQRVRVELEYGSRNFAAHGHNPDDCDVIVCWI